MTIETSAGRGRIRPAWVVLGGAFGAFTLSAALMHSYPVYLVAFIADFGWSRAETSIAYSVSQLVGGASSPLVGYLVDRWDRAGSCCSAAGCLSRAFSAAPSSRRCGRSYCSTASS
jgi:MFS family permease